MAAAFSNDADHKEELASFLQPSQEDIRPHLIGFDCSETLCA